MTAPGTRLLNRACCDTFAAMGAPPVTADPRARTRPTGHRYTQLVQVRLGAALNAMLARIEDFVTEREASQAASRRFFADASHELRTPLASLRANAELYQQGALPRRDQVDEAMRRITLEAQRMGGLVDDMLRLARLDQQPGQRCEPIHVGALAAECGQRARTSHPDWTWRSDITDGLEVAGDEELLRRAIDNILGNVAAHTPEGSTATLTAIGRDGQVILDVSDDGPGVLPEQLPRIFDRFYRASVPSRRPGSGLGLAIVAAVATAHGGQVTAAANQPHGLSVTPHPARGPPGDAHCAGRQLRSPPGLHRPRAMLTGIPRCSAPPAPGGQCAPGQGGTGLAAGHAGGEP